MSEENQFRLKFKYYKRKKPPPSFDNVIDPSKSDHTKLFDTLHNTETADVDNNIEDAHTNNVKDWKIAKFKSSPGLVFISNVFSKDDQLYWASKCLKEYSSDTYKRNKTKVLSVQLGKTLAFVKFGSGVGWRGGGTLDSSSLILKRPTYQILASCYA